jgi:REP element-mobilizing transposase RayT
MPKQLTIKFPRNAGRPRLPAKQRGQKIWHRPRPELPKGKPVHVTLEGERKILGSLRNKQVFRELRQAMRRARLKGVRILDFTLQHDHVHLLLETSDKYELGEAMRALSISFTKRLSYLAGKKIRAFKTRYHLSLLKSLAQIKAVAHYIATNGKKHGTINSGKTDWYTSTSFKLTPSSISSSYLALRTELLSLLTPPRFHASKLALNGFG